MKIEQLKAKLFLSSSMIVLLISLTIFCGFFRLGIGTDIGLHAQVIERIAKNDLLPPPNFLYYLIIYIFAFFRTDVYTVYLASTFVLSLAVTAKYIITKHFIIKYSNNYQSDIFYSLSSILLIFVFCVPISLLLKGNYYIGNIPSNVWHNSTTIFLMPFALLLFWKSYEQLQEPKENRVFLLSGLIIINLLIKTSYLFVFLLLYPLLLIKSFYQHKKQLFLNLIPVLIGYLGVAIQYIAIYIFQIGALYEGDSKTVISLFTVWSHFSSNIPISFLSSTLFPLVYLCFYWQDIKNNLLIKYAVFQYLIGIMFFAVFMETGPRQFHGNFIWQAVVTSYMLYMVCLTLFIEKMRVKLCNLKISIIDIFNQLTVKNKIILSCILLQFISGLLYIIKIFIKRSYS